MVSGRVELTPDEQLKGLRETRDHYLSLADQIKNNSDPLTEPQKRQAEEMNARRIASSYDKSIANSLARMPAANPARAIKWRSLSLRTWLWIFVGISALEGAFLIANVRPALRSVSPTVSRSTHRESDQVALLPSEINPAPKAAPLVPLALPTAETHKSPIQAAKPTIANVPPLMARATETATSLRERTSKNSLPKLAQTRTRVRLKVAARPTSAATTSPGERGEKAKIPQPPTASVPQTPILPAKSVASPTASEGAGSINVATLTPPAPSTASARLESIMQTHLAPPYPDDARRRGEEGATEMALAISVEGIVSDCEIARSSGWQDLDMSACIYVIRHWRWRPPKIDGQPVTAKTKVTVAWGLKSPN